MTKPKSEKLDLEKSLQRLEQIAEKLEEGKLSLEDSLKYFEEGIQLTRLCQEKIKQAEQKVAILMKENDEYVLKNFQELDEESE